MIANLSERVQFFQKLIEAIPPAYLPKDLKVALLNQTKSRIEKLAELAPENNKYKERLNSVTTLIKETQASNNKPPAPQIQSPQEAAQLKSSLLKLSKTVEALTQNGSLQATAGQQYLANIQQAFIEANVNYIISQGDTSRRENKERLAIHNYQKAIAELTKHNKGNQFSDKIAQLKATIAELSEAAGMSTNDPSHGSELTQGMQDLTEDQDAWKKKYF